MLRYCVLTLLALPSSLLVTTICADEPVQTGLPRRVLVGDYGTKKLAIVDGEGKIEWEQPIGDIHDAQVLKNGNILFQRNFGEVVEFNREGQVVWRYQPPAGPPRVEIHAFQRLADGNTMIAESGRGRIIEVDGAGKIVSETPLQIQKNDPHRDTRLVRKLTSGNYLVAHEGEKSVREYARDGKVVWQYDIGTKVYSVSRLANGNTLLGTGDGHSAVEVNPEGKIVWQVGERDLPGVKLGWVTMVERLPNGNTVIVNCHCGPDNPQIVEVTPNKQVVWSFKDFKRFGNNLPVAVVLDEVAKQ